MFVGSLKLDLTVLESRSLKEKRMVVRRIKDRVRQRYGLAVVEVGALELWQRAELGVAVAGGERVHLLQLLDSVWRCIAETEGAELLQSRREIVPFAGEVFAVPTTHAGDQESWVPAQWQQQVDEESR